MTDDLRAAIEAAIPHLTEAQALAAGALLTTLTPPMEEPTWPGAGGWAVMLALSIPAPGKWLSTNSTRRDVWAQAKGVKEWRTLAATLAAGYPPFTGPVIVEAVVHKSRNNRWDVDGVTPTVKAIIDGVRDAGVLAEDDDKHVVALNVRVGCVCKPARVELRVWEVS